MMARPSRNASPDAILSSARTFFATTNTSQGCPLLQSERNATLMIDVLRSYARAGKFRLYYFVVMPDHVHLLMTVGGGMTVERAMQFIKGGFSETRVESRQSCLAHRKYIAANPVKEGPADAPGEFPYCFAYLAKRKATGAKAL